MACILATASSSASLRDSGLHRRHQDRLRCTLGYAFCWMVVSRQDGGHWYWAQRFSCNHRYPYCSSWNVWMIWLHCQWSPTAHCHLTVVSLQSSTCYTVSLSQVNTVALNFEFCPGLHCVRPMMSTCMHLPDRIRHVHVETEM